MDFFYARNVANAISLKIQLIGLEAYSKGLNMRWVNKKADPLLVLV